MGPLATPATNKPIVSAPGGYYDGEIGGMIGRRNLSTRKKNLSQSHFVHHETYMPAWTRTQAATVGSQRLTAWSMAWPA
jgi:hypothetical protein